MDLPNTKMWMIRAGRDGTVIHHFLNEDVAYLGWGIGVIRPTDTNANIRQRLRECYPQENPGALPNIVGMLKRFSCEVRIGETLVTYDPQRRLYHFGIAKSDAEHQHVVWVDLATGNEVDDELGYVRKVDWVSTLSRDSLSKFTQNALNPQLSHFRVSDQASEEIRRLST
ncbi:MAG: hypothetical protein F4X64_04205 [Chloroflexi bacterium]|nr:hypothetical protein [Chloroflexota bacterium]